MTACRPTLFFRFATLALVAFALGSATPGRAQETTPDAPALDGTLESFVNAAVIANPSLAAVRYRADAARSSVGTHGVLPDPMLAFGYFIETPETRVGPQQSMWMLTQRLPFFGKRGLDRKIASRTADIADQDVERHLLDLRLDVERAFYEYYRVTRVAGVLEEERGILTRMQQVAQVRYASGLVSQQDVLKAQLSLSQVEDQIHTIDQHTADAEAALNTLLNRPPDTPLPAPVGADTLVETPPADTLVAIALERRPEVQGAQIQIDRAHDARTLAHRGYFPDLTVGAQYVQVGKRDVTGLEDNGKDIFQVNAAINIPIWFGKHGAAAEQAEADAARATSEKAFWDVRIRNDVRDADERVGIAKQRVVLYRTLIIPQAEQAFRASEADYQTGKADFLSYLDSERMLLSVRRQYFTVVADYGVQRARLARTVGTPMNTVR